MVNIKYARIFCSLLVFFRAPITPQLAKQPRVFYAKPLHKSYLFRRITTVEGAVVSSARSGRIQKEESPTVGYGS